MKLSISNIAWGKEKDIEVYHVMNDLGFNGLEIAPTRVFPDNPYEQCLAAKQWASQLLIDYKIIVSSIQSIWFGRSEMMFGSDLERSTLLDYTKKAVIFAEAIGCRNIVFGCPRNRVIPDSIDERIYIDFFKEIGDYAAEHMAVIAMEANPAIYNTNFIIDTISAFDLIEKVDSEGFRLNLDLGTMIENNESISILKGREGIINHVHISEPMLRIVEERKEHYELAKILNDYGYDNYISIEVGKQNDVSTIKKMMAYVKEIFG